MEPHRAYLDEELVRTPAASASSKPPTRREELLTAARACVDTLADIAADLVNQVLSQHLSGCKSRTKAKRKRIHQEREDEEDEKADEEQTSAAAAAGTKRKQPERSMAELQQEAAERRAAQEAERVEREVKWRRARDKQLSQQEETKGARPLEGTSQLGPIALMRLQLDPSVPPPWLSNDPIPIIAERLREQEWAMMANDFVTRFQVLSTAAASGSRHRKARRGGNDRGYAKRTGHDN